MSVLAVLSDGGGFGSLWIVSHLLFFVIVLLYYMAGLTSSRSMKTQKKEELGQYPAILTSHLVNNAYRLVRPFRDERTWNRRTKLLWVQGWGLW